MTRAAALALPALLSAIATFADVTIAQERRSLGGRVVDDAKRPVAGASVLLTTPRAPHLAVAAPEVVTVTTDANGQFKAAVLVGAPYTMGAVRVDGDEVAASPLATGGGAGEFRELVLGSPRPCRDVRVDGLPAWGEQAPTRLRLCLRHAPGLTADVDLTAHDTTKLPALPCGALLCEFVTASGATLAHTEIADAGRGDGPLVLTLPPPRRVVAHVRDAAGKPVAGARIAERTVDVHHTSPGAIGICVREAWREHGRTDADGALAMAVASQGDWFRVFRADADGFATAVAARVGADERAIDARRDARAPGDELHFELATLRPLTGRLARDGKTPLAGARAWVEVTCQLPLPQGGTVHVPLLEAVTTDAQGSWRAIAVPDDFVLPRLLAGPDLPAPPGLQLPWILVEAAGRVAELPPVVLQELLPVDVSVTRDDGSPAEGATVCVVPTARRRWFVETWDTRHRLDRAGRARLATAAAEALLCCTDGIGFASAPIDQTTARLALQLEPLPTARWRIRTPAGEPAAAAELVLARCSPAVGETDPRRQALAAVAVSLHSAWCDGLRADAGGRLELRRVPAPGLVMELSVAHRSGRLEGVRFAAGEHELQLH